MKRKIFLTFLIFSFLAIPVFSQEVEPANTGEPVPVIKEETSSAAETETPPAPETQSEELNIKGEEFTTAENFGAFIRSMDFIFDIGPAVYINQNTYINGTPVSAPSPFFDPVTIGILWPNYTFVSMEPSLSYFSFYYIWHNGMALPGEIENRTVSTLHFMLNLPIVIQLYLKNNRIQLSVGAGILGRFALLPGGVQDSEPGESGTVESDMKLINEWFWNKTRYLYLSTGVSWLYNAYHNVKVGPTAKVYFPLGGIINGEGFQGMIIDVGLKISL